MPPPPQSFYQSHPAQAQSQAYPPSLRSPPSPDPWPRFPSTYGALLDFLMPQPSYDATQGTSTAPWSGLHPPSYPLCFAYQDNTIITRALSGLRDYFDRDQLFDRVTPSNAHVFWDALQSVYSEVVYDKERWLTSVVVLLAKLIQALSDAEFGKEELKIRREQLRWEPS